MGSLFYGGMTDPIVIPDDVLAHLKMVATSKLRRGECFPLSWQHPVGAPVGRTTIWVHASIPLRFEFDTAEPISIDNTTLHRFVDDANSTRGLVIDVNPPVNMNELIDSELVSQPA